MEVRTISSALTFIYKYVFTTVWIGGFGLGTLGLWWRYLHEKTQHLQDSVTSFSTAWIIGSSFILLFCAGLKRVRIDDKNVYVSNYLREITIPIKDVKEVTENRFVNIRPITIFLRSATIFGDKIRFMPTGSWIPFWRAHPIVDTLERAAALAAEDRPDSNTAM